MYCPQGDMCCSCSFLVAHANVFSARGEMSGIARGPGVLSCSPFNTIAQYIVYSEHTELLVYHLPSSACRPGPRRDLRHVKLLCKLRTR